MTMRPITTAFGCTIFAGRCGYTTSSLATSNCINAGGALETVYGPDGSSYNICVFSNESACEEWMFFRNECSTTNPMFVVYCADSGGELSLEETVDGSGEYEVCTLNGVQCSDFDYYELNKCPFTSTSVDDDSLCVASGGTSRPMGTRRTASSVDGREYFLCYFGSDNACEMGKLMSGECDENTPNLISFCADNGGMMSLGGVEPHEYEVCTLADGIKCIEEHYYLHNNCTTTKEVDPTEIPPDNDSCSSATVISAVPFEQEGTATGATTDIWATDPSCNFQQVSIGNGVWYIIEGVETGRKQILVTCRFMDCMLLSTNSTLGNCPSTYLCADAWVGRGEYNAITYTLTTEADGIYYVYISPTDENPGPGYMIKVDEVPPPTPAPTSTRDSSIPVNGVDAPWLVLESLIHIVMFTIMYGTVV